MKDLCTPTPFLQPGTAFTATHTQTSVAGTAATTANVHINLNEWVEDIAKGLFTGIESDAHARFSYALAQRQLDRAVVENQMKTEFRKVALMVLNTLSAADGPLKGLTSSQTRAFEPIGPIGAGARFVAEEEVAVGATHQESAATDREEETYNFAALKEVAHIIDNFIQTNKGQTTASLDPLMAAAYAIAPGDYPNYKTQYNTQHGKDTAFKKVKR